MNTGMITNWYTKVSKDISLIPECIKHFEAEFQQAKKECSIWGNLEKASASMPGVVEHRFNQLQELEAILEYLNIEYRRLRSKTFKKFLENYNKKLSSRDADKYVDGDADVVDLAKILNEFALIRNGYLGITKGLDQKQWQLTKIVKLRVAGMEEANIR